VQPLLPSDPTQVGRYELEGRLGTGGMGTVYLGRSPGGRLAAVKVVLLTVPDTLARFQREAVTLRTVRSAYTAALIDCELAVPPYWMATEFIPGPTLAAVLDTEGPMSIDECLLLTASLAEGLSDIHAHGICHRDLKPQNIIISATGPHLIDFGLARNPAETGLTQADIIVGTPGYIAPELLTSPDELTPAADVFALGATIAHAATGRRPYGVGRAESIFYRILHEDIDLAGLDPGLEHLVRSCVAQDPARRPRPDEIIEWCRRRRSGVVSPSWSGTPPSRTDPPAEIPRARPRWRLPLVLGGVTVAVALVAGAAFAALPLSQAQDGQSATPATAASPSAPVASQTPAADRTSPKPSVAVTSATTTRKPAPTRPPVTTVTSADGRCIQVPPTDVNGFQVQAAACDGSTGQQWRFTKEGALMPAAATATRCLDIGGNAGADIDYRIQFWDCNFGDAQLWVPQSDGALFNAQSGRCLSILPDEDGGPALAIRSCTGTAAQRWKLPTASA